MPDCSVASNQTSVCIVVANICSGHAADGLCQFVYFCELHCCSAGVYFAVCTLVRRLRNQMEEGYNMAHARVLQHLWTCISALQSPR